MSDRRSGEDGMALLVVMVLMGVMLTAGFAIASTVDTQTGASQAERVRDSAFNLAESALNAQIFALGRDWPGLGAARVPPTTLPYGTCTQASTSTRCPDNAYLSQGGSPDLTGATWETTVRDNGPVGAPSSFYSDTQSPPYPGYDANNDGKVWVRAQAVAQGRKRTLVALVRSEQQEEDLPHAALIAGSLKITNNGNKELIRSNNGLVAVRCDPLADPLAPCLGHALLPPNGSLTALLGTLANQVSGATPVSDPALGAAMTPEARARLKTTAIANGSYYASCPTEAQLSGQIVYVESGNCTYAGNAQFNTPQAPGVLVMNAGTVTFDGTTKFYGVVYNANTANSTSAGVKTQGNALINGGVIIDGNAQMTVGSSALNIQFDLNAYRAVASYGSAGVIQNTWREIRAG